MEKKSSGAKKERGVMGRTREFDTDAALEKAMRFLASGGASQGLPATAVLQSASLRLHGRSHCLIEEFRLSSIPRYPNTTLEFDQSLDRQSFSRILLDRLYSSGSS